MRKLFHVTEKYLNDNPNHIFVFGDNIIRKGYGGAATLRDHPQSYGFITKRFPNNSDESYYTPDEYIPVLNVEIQKLKQHIEQHPTNTYLLSECGSCRANKYGIAKQIRFVFDKLEKEYPERIVLLYPKVEQ
jgi:hypothetical protein